MGQTKYVAQRGFNMFPVSKFGTLRRSAKEQKNKSEALPPPSAPPPSCDRVVVCDTGSRSRFHKRQRLAKYIKLRKAPSNFKPLNFVAPLDHWMYLYVSYLGAQNQSLLSQVPVRFFWHSLPGIWDCIQGKPGVLRCRWGGYNRDLFHGNPTSHRARGKQLPCQR